MQPSAQDSAASFYSKLVDISASAGNTGKASWRSADAATAQQQPPANSAEPLQQWQHSSAAASAGGPGVPFKPVKFAQPVILDPNTGMMTLPPKASDQPAADHAAHATSSKHAASHSSRSQQQAHRHAMHLDFGSQASRYRFNSSRAQPQQQQQQQQQQPQHPTGPSPAGSSVQRPIEQTNIGYQLLQKAGWQEGKGLGRAEQGMAAPLQVAPPKGTKGLGFAPQQTPSHQGGPNPAAAGSAAAGEAAAGAIGPVLGVKRVAALVAAELAAEDVETKVKRHRQVMLQEAKVERDKAIQSYLYRSFNEPSMADTGDDANPLGKNHRLTATNPLLD